MGANPAYISIDPSGRHVTVANHAGYDPAIRIRDGAIERVYDEATIAMFDVKPDGSLTDAVAIAALDPGAGPVPEAWTGLPASFAASPHAHSVNWDPSGKWILVCDKGADRIYTFAVRGDELVRAQRFEARPGSSPRHSAFHLSLPLVLVVNEQGPTLGLYHFDVEVGTIRHLQTVDTVATPSRFGDPVYLPADVHIHPNGRTVYATTRRSETVAVFRLSTDPYRLDRVQVLPCGGSTPRTCAIEPGGRFLFIGNQDSGYISTFAIERESGQLSPIGRQVSVPKPVTVKFALL
jgi:6-phosphogluconolactonase